MAGAAAGEEAEVVAVAQARDKIIIVILVAVAVAIAAFLWSGVASGQLQMSGFAAGFILFVLPFLAAAAYLLFTMLSEGKQLNALEKEQRVLDAIRSRGKTTFSELSKESGMGEPEVRAAVEGLVGKNLFTGSINWKSGEVFSSEAAELVGGKKCPSCGAALEIVGKGMAKCAYCGTEVYA